jgi:hypothetical protein
MSSHNSPASAPAVVLFSTDLMLISSVSGAAAARELRFSSVASPDELTPKMAEGPLILCLDLAAAQGHPEWVAEKVSPEVIQRGIAFGPHVHTAKLELARQTGFGRVLSRGQFVSRMREEIADALKRIQPAE